MQKLRLGLAVGVLLFAAGTSVAQAPPPPAQATATEKLRGLDDLAAEAMRQWKVPGLAMAVVQNGKVIYAKGYGYRDVERKLPVTTETLFPIGSISKSFTSLTFAALNDEGKVDWDKPVREYLPEFKLYDATASENATPRDLFSHRTGLPRNDLVWYSSDFSRADLVSRLRYLKPNKEFRTTYQYNNLTVTTMGYLEGKITGRGWEGAVRTKVFEPLDMTQSDFSVVDLEKTANHALPYELKKEVVTKVPYRNIDQVGPAGSIDSSVDDMSHYLIFQLGDGTYHGKRIVSENNLRQMHDPQTAIPDPPPPVGFKELGHHSYGLGWVVTSYRGHNLVWHNGGIDGFYALLSLLPDDRLGVVILTNLGGNKAPEVLAYNVYDRILGLDQLPWLSRFKDLDAKQKKGEDESKKSKSSDRKPGTHPSHDLKDYAGEYTNLGYGTVKIGLNGDVLELKLNKLGPYPLPHYHYDIFEIPEDADSPVAGVRFQFQTNKQGEIDGVSAALEPALPEDTVFTRTPRKVSPGELEALVGDYNLGELTATVSLANDVLHLSVPGQPQYQLAPSKGLSFNIEGLPGYAVEFKKDSVGRVAELIFNQPNGVFTAKRK